MTLLQEVKAATDTLEIDRLLEAHPWLLERDHKCIISPDADGQLCGLLMSHVLGWEIVGYYDGKAMVCHHDQTQSMQYFLTLKSFALV